MDISINHHRSLHGNLLRGKSIPSELAPMEDKSAFRVFATAPEGTSYELMDEYMLDVLGVAGHAARAGSLHLRYFTRVRVFDFGEFRLCLHESGQSPMTGNAPSKRSFPVLPRY
jgi:hypothetical protein